MGIFLCPEVFQTKMKETLEGPNGRETIIYDIIVYSCTKEGHDRRLKAVLTRIAESGLKLT